LEVEEEEVDQPGWPAALDLGPASTVLEVMVHVKGYAHKMNNFLKFYKIKFLSSVLYVC
jgi:hypothetical protein